MFELAVIILIFIFSYFLVIKDFKFSIYVLIFVSFLQHKELFSFYRWNLLPIRSFMLALMLGVLTKIYFEYFHKGKLKEFFSLIKEPTVFLLLLLWLVRGISIVNSRNLQESILLYGFFTTVCFFVIWFFKEFRNDPKQILKYLKFFIFLTFLLTVFGYYQFYLYQTTGKIIGALWNIPGKLPRVGALFWDVNHYGALLTASIILLGYFLLTEKKFKNIIINLLMMVSMLGALLLTNSRTAWIFAGISLLTFLAILSVKKIGLKAILFMILLMTAVTIPAVMEYNNKASPFRKEIKDYFHYRLDSFDSHIMLIEGSYQIFEEYPVLGGGYGSFYEHFSKTKIAPTYFGRDTAALTTRVPAHTIWGEIISETGVLGLIIFIVFVFFLISTPVYVAMKSRDKKEVFLAALFASTWVGWLVAGIFYSYNTEFFWVFFALNLCWISNALSKYGKSFDVANFFYSHKLFYPMILVFLSVFLIFVNLGKNHLIPWDEAIYAQISKNIVSGGNWINLYWPRIPNIWYEKPPLSMWLVALSMLVFGVNSWAVRIQSALAGISLIFGVYYFVKKHFNKDAGFISALALLTTTQFLYYSRIGMTDVLSAAFISFSLFTYYKSIKSNKTLYWALSGLFIGLSVMTKGVVGLFPFGIIFLNEAFLILIKGRKLNFKVFENYFLLILVSALVFLPWHFLMYQQHGDLFLQNYLGYHVIQRAVSAIEEKGKPFFWYFIVLKVSMRIWFVAFLASIPSFLYYFVKKDKTIVFLSLWSFFVFLLFSLAKSKMVWYIMPIYPALSIFAGVFTFRAINYFLRAFYLDSAKMTKAFMILIVSSFSLFYLFMNRELVYTSDTTKSLATLLKMKDRELGTSELFYIDRVELPLAFFYTESDFESIDFRPDDEKRVPKRSYDERLILLTKNGRFSTSVVGVGYSPRVVAEDGDWILWYFDSQKNIDTVQLKNLKIEYENAILKPNIYRPTYEILEEIRFVEEKISKSEITLPTD